MPFAGFTDIELLTIHLRTSGVPPAEIARIRGVSLLTVQDTFPRIYRKAGVQDLVALTRWAMENGLDVALGPETSEERAYPGKPKVRGNLPIKMGRVRRAMR